VTTIYVLAYPKSGTTWLCRLLGDALASPVGGMMPKSDGKAIATEGQSRPGPHMIRQGHAVPCKGEDRSPNGRVLVPDHNHIDVGLCEDEKVVLMMRDPRDVAVSGAHHWGRDLRDFIAQMGEGKWPVPHGGGWQNWYAQWEGKANAAVSFEALHRDTTGILDFTLFMLGLEPANDLDEVVERQSFEARKRYAEQHGDKLNYGKEFQLRFLRKGTVGDWKNHFGKEETELAERYFQPLMGELGY